MSCIVVILPAWQVIVESKGGKLTVFSEQFSVSDLETLDDFWL